MKQLRPLLKHLWLTVAAAGWLYPTASNAGTIPYTFQTLDNNADPTFNQLLGINNTGTIVGYFGVGSATNPNRGYTLAPPYGQGNYTNENFPGAFQTQVVGINNNGTTVGFWADAASNNFGFVKQGNIYTPVVDPNTPKSMTLFNQLLGVNDNNVAVGVYADSNGDFQAYSYTISGAKFAAITLPGSFNAMMTTATDINNAGVICGYYVDFAGNTHGFIDNGGKFTSFDDPQGVGMNTSFLGLNNKGEVVGSYVGGAGITNGLTFNYLTNTWRTVDDPLGSPNPAFDVTGTTINGVNDLGQLVGFYSDGTNVDGFLASPAVPEPASIGLMAAGIGAFVWIRRRWKAQHA